MRAKVLLRTQPVTAAGDMPSKDLMEAIQRLVADGLTLEAAIPAAITADQSVSRVKLQTSVAASGTGVTFTGIPAWVNRVTVLGNGISTNGTNRLRVLVGDGAIVAAGYLGAVTQIDGAVPVTALYTIGAFLVENQTAAMAFRFRCVIERQGGNVWIISGNGAFSNIASTTNFAGEISLTNALDRVRLTGGGTDTFDAGSVAISWE